MKNGYIRVRINGGYVYEHRHIMEQFLGRKLTRTESVHHKNLDRTDNRVENLKIMDKRKHDGLHTKKRWVEDRASFSGNKEICGKPRTERHGRGLFCKKIVPCHFHAEDP